MLREKWGKEVPVIPNPVEDSFLRANEKHFNPASPIIVSMSNGFGGLKNHESLIRAFALVRRRIHDCQLHLVGYDFEPDGIARQWAMKNNLDEGIVYLGELKRPQILSVLDSAALMVHPSLEESFGNVLIEAMARRIPVVAGKDSGAVPWVLAEGKAGLLCDVLIPEQIASAAIRLLLNFDLWKQFSQVGYDHVVNNFGTSAVCELCEAEYMKILSVPSKNHEHVYV
jgi:glycosyltransferase involved in cell wall biosynthesis